MDIGTESEPYYVEPAEDPFETPEPERRERDPLPDPTPARPEPVKAPAGA